MKKNILSISSNKAMRFLLQTILHREYSNQSCDNVFVASSKLKTSAPFDMMIVDIAKGESDNWEFVHFVQSSSIYEMPIIVLADSAEIDEHEGGEDIYFFSKPFDPQELVRTISEIALNRAEQI